MSDVLTQQLRLAREALPLPTKVNKNGGDFDCSHTGLSQIVCGVVIFVFTVVQYSVPCPVTDQLRVGTGFWTTLPFYLPAGVLGSRLGDSDWTTYRVANIIYFVLSGLSAVFGTVGMFLHAAEAARGCGWYFEVSATNYICSGISCFFAFLVTIVSVAGCVFVGLKYRDRSRFD